jgi:anti-sigma factor RsiW
LEKIANNDQLIARYLLGRLSESEAERLDELSLTDDEFAARLQVVENDLVDAYVRGELSGEELESFHSYYLASPRRREKVAIARGLQAFIGRTADSRQPEAAPRRLSAASLSDQPGARKSFFRRYFFEPGPATRWGMAAAALLLLLLTAGWLVSENLRLRNQIQQARSERDELQRREEELRARLQQQGGGDSQSEQELASLRQQLARLEEQLARQQGAKSPPKDPPAEPRIFAFALAPQLRGAGQVATLAIPADADSVRLELQLEANDFPFYRAALKAQPGDALVWRGAGLRPISKGDGKTLVVVLGSARLKARRYAIEVQGVSSAGDAEVIGYYVFRVVK